MTETAVGIREHFSAREIFEEQNIKPDLRLIFGDESCAVVFKYHPENRAFPCSVYVKKQRLDKECEASYQGADGKTEIDALRGIGLVFSQTVLGHGEEQPLSGKE